MSIAVNGTTIPTNGDFIVANGVIVTKVVANGAAVWEQQKETVIASNVNTKFDRFGNALDMTYNLTGYSRLRVIMTSSFSNPHRGPYDHIRVFIGTGSWVNLIEGGYQDSYHFDHTFDIGWLTGACRIRVEVGFDGDEDSDVEITSTVSQVILYP